MLIFLDLLRQYDIFSKIGECYAEKKWLLFPNDPVLNETVCKCTFDDLHKLTIDSIVNTRSCYICSVRPHMAYIYSANRTQTRNWCSNDYTFLIISEEYKRVNKSWIWLWGDGVFTEVTGFDRGDGVLYLSKNNRRWTHIDPYYSYYLNEAADDDINTYLWGVDIVASFITVNGLWKSNPDCNFHSSFTYFASGISYHQNLI